MIECECDSEGSLTKICNPLNGQCACKKSVVGKNCDQCEVGFYGFPNCKGNEVLKWVFVSNISL